MSERCRTDWARGEPCWISKLCRSLLWSSSLCRTLQRGKQELKQRANTHLALLESDVSVSAKLTPDVKRNEQGVEDKYTVWCFWPAEHRWGYLLMERGSSPLRCGQSKSSLLRWKKENTEHQLPDRYTMTRCSVLMNLWLQHVGVTLYPKCCEGVCRVQDESQCNESGDHIWYYFSRPTWCRTARSSPHLSAASSARNKNKGSCLTRCYRRPHRNTHLTSLWKHMTQGWE